MASIVVAAQTIPRFRYLSAWFCPYAHRATLALEHHKGRVEYEWVEALGWYQKEVEDSQLTSSTSDTTSREKEWYYHWKADELKEANPSGLVPTLIPYHGTDGDRQPNPSRAIYESLVTVDYIDAVSRATGRDRLNPEDPYWAAKCRIWTDRVNRECCSPYYDILVRKDPTERLQHFSRLLEGLVNFSGELAKTNGPVFLPDAQLSNVDLALLPWAYRYYVLEHYRGSDFVIPLTGDLEAYHQWFHYCINLDSVKRTLPDKDRYLKHIAKYADGSARSKVANAVRRGVAAHEIDDKKDEY